MAELDCFCYCVGACEIVGLMVKGLGLQGNLPQVCVGASVAREQCFTPPGDGNIFVSEQCFAACITQQANG